jgi:thiol-disulfide isomerase/thioredoxin
LTFAAKAQNGFEVRIKVSNAKDFKPAIDYRLGLKLIRDSIYTIENGEFVFRGSVPGPMMASIFNRADKQRFTTIDLSMVLSNDKILIEGDASQLNIAKITGGIDNNDFALTRLAMEDLTKKSLAISRQLSKLPTKIDSVSKKSSWVGADSLLAAMQHVAKMKQDLMDQYIKEHPLSFIAYYKLYGSAQSKVSGSEEVKKTAHKLLADNYKKFNGLYKGSPYTAVIEERIASNEVADANMPGKAVKVSFSKKDMNGQLINLSDLKGKYVVIDFWGSWCVPCRKSHPHLKELYAKYKDKGLEMISISYEKSAPEEWVRDWKKAVKQDGLTWIQMLNNEDAGTFDAAKAYGIQAFPTHLLLDKNGEIIMREEGDTGELEKKLKEVLGDL